MKKYIEQVGNIKIYEDRHSEKDTTISLYNGSDLVATDVYFTNDTNAAIADLLIKALDTYTIEWIKNKIMDFTALSENTYRAFEKDYFCRIDNTRYFKHFHKSPEEFIADKSGKRIIDK